MIDKLNIVCTDKGQHKRTRLTRVRGLVSNRIELEISRSFFPPDDMRPAECRWMRPEPTQVFLLDCPRCARYEQLRPEKWVTLIVRATENGVSKVDISQLPF